MITFPFLKILSKRDFRYMLTDNARISKQAIKEKPTLATESWENKNEVYKNR